MARYRSPSFFPGSFRACLPAGKRMRLPRGSPMVNFRFFFLVFLFLLSFFFFFPSPAFFFPGFCDFFSPPPTKPEGPTVPQNRTNPPASTKFFPGDKKSIISNVCRLFHSPVAFALRSQRSPQAQNKQHDQHSRVLCLRSPLGPKEMNRLVPEIGTGTSMAPRAEPSNPPACPSTISLPCGSTTAENAVCFGCTPSRGTPFPSHLFSQPHESGRALPEC